MFGFWNLESELKKMLEDKVFLIFFFRKITKNNRIFSSLKQGLKFHEKISEIANHIRLCDFSNYHDFELTKSNV
jgi:hypothetical protein